MNVTSMAKAGVLGSDMSPEMKSRYGKTSNMGSLNIRDYANTTNAGKSGNGTKNDTQTGAKKCSPSNFTTDSDMGI